MATQRPVEYYQIIRAISKVAHAGQLDKAGKPYFTHPERVALKVMGYGLGFSCVAYLHDVLEDTAVTAEDLLDVGVSEIQVEAVIAITHLTGEPREDYYHRVAKNRLARVVKIADIRDNMDPDRLALLDEKTRDRLITKYTKALEFFGEKI